MPAPTIARDRSTEVPPRSSFTASQPASLTKRCAVRMASSLETSYEPNGRSPTSSGVDEPTPDGGGEHEQLVERHRNRGGVAEHRHGAGVAHEHHVHAGLLGDLGARVVVCGDHGDRLAEGLLAGERGERDRLALGGRGGGART